tara:strand:+ start:1216 stop:1386 length:171 start_codon:yes stop_codon:yes gene_type:complete
MDELFSPVKYSYGNVEGQGTKDSPFVITRRKVVDTTYHGWYDDDGSYHETPVKEKE